MNADKGNKTLRKRKKKADFNIWKEAVIARWYALLKIWVFPCGDISGQRVQNVPAIAALNQQIHLSQSSESSESSQRLQLDERRKGNIRLEAGLDVVLR